MYPRLTQFYLCLNFLRGAHLITISPSFADFCSSTAYLESLAAYDHNFITPIIIIAANFVLLKGSRHPFWIHINHPGNLMHCLNLAFMGGLLFVPVPGVYHFAYLGLLLGHITMRFVRHTKDDLFRKLPKIK
jgi:hypothetical protein